LITSHTISLSYQDKYNEKSQEHPSIGYDHPYGSAFLPKANSNSSLRIKCAYNEGITALKKSPSTSNKRRRRNSRNKILASLFVDCQKAPPHLCRPLVPNTFFDGSIQPDCPTTSRPESIQEDDWISVSISKGEIGVVKVPADPNIGVSYPMPLYNPYLCPPPFALAPRARVLKFTRLDCEDFAKLVFKSAQAVEQIQGSSTERHCKVLGDEVKTHKYVGCWGVLPNRKSPGVSESAVTKKTPTEYSKTLQQFAHSI
jgi:hypothetical protein